MKRLFFFISIISSTLVFAQKGHIDLDIKVIDDALDSLPMDEARVRIIQNQKVLFDEFTDSTGKIKKISIPISGEYLIKVDKKGYALKFGKIDANYFDPSFLSGGIKFPMVVSLVKPTEKEDYAFLQRDPMIKFYIDSLGNQAWDEEHLSMMLLKVERCKDGWTAEEADNFVEPYSMAQNQANKGDYTEALANYKEAQKFRDSPEIQTAIKDCEIGITINETNELMYNNFLQIGDQLLANKRYEEAGSYFYKAHELKPNEKYPQEKIAQCEAIVSSQN